MLKFVRKVYLNGLKENKLKLIYFLIAAIGN